MKISKHIKIKMHRIADLNRTANVLSIIVDEWFISRGLDIEELRCGDGYSLNELDLGNDITDILCDRIEKGFGTRNNN